MESNFKAQSEDHYSSFPYELALDERYIETFKQFINSLRYDNAGLLALIDRLIQATNEKDKETIRFSIQHYLTNPQADYNYQNYLNWLDENSQNLGMPPTKIELIQTIVRLNIRDKVADPSNENVSAPTKDPGAQERRRNEVVKHVTDLLRQRYQEPAYAELKRLLHERTFPITESFINLAIVKEHEQKPKEDEQLKGNKLISRDEYINSFETIYQPKAPIKIEDLLLAQQDENKAPKRQLIEGRAGIGKTTLCQYLAHQWAVGDNKWQTLRQQFDWVIHLSLRQLTAEEQYDFSKLTLVNWVYKYHLTSVVQQSFTEAEFAEAWHALNTQRKVLLLLDGYDEIVPALKSNPSLQHFFEQALLSCEHWLVFSRPYYFTDNRVDRRLENIGFTQDDIPKYVQQYFRDVEKETRTSQQGYANSLMAYLNQNQNAMGIAHIPINLELLCYAWESGTYQLNNQLTLTELYNHLVLSLFSRYLHKYYPKDIASASGITWNDIQEDQEFCCQQILVFLEQLAWHQMQQPGLIISAEVIKKIVSDLYPGLKYKSQREVFGEVVLKQLGLLKGCDIHKPTLEQSYYFIHLTFQEYFAARHWVKLFKGEKSEAEAIEILQANKFNPRCEIVWWMVAGLLKADRAHLTAFFELLSQVPRDLAGLNQQLLQLRCLEECQLNLSKNQKNRLLATLGQWLNHEIDKEKNYKFNFIATYLGMGLQVSQQEPIKQVLAACLKKHKLDRLAILAKQLILPLEIIMQLETLLSDPDESVRSDAAKALGNQSSLPESVYVPLLALLSDPDGDVRYAAALALGNQSSLPESVYVPLGALLSDPDRQVRYVAVRALGKQSSLPESVYVPLLALLSDRDWQIRFAAAEALGKQSSLPESVYVPLLALLSDPDWQVRYAAAEALGKQSSLSESIYVQLVALLSDPNEIVRSAAAKVLGKRSSLPQSIYVQLGALLSDLDRHVRSAAAYALGNQSSLPESVYVQLRALLIDPDKHVKYAAADALGNQSSLPESIYVPLVALLSDPYRHVRSAAARALRNQSSLPESVYVQLGALLSDPDGDVRYAAARALGNQSSLPESIYVPLVALLSDRLVRSAAVRALGKQSSLPESVYVPLGALLSDPDRQVRYVAVRALGKQSSLPESVCVQLVALLSDPDWQVRYAAARALGKQSSLSESVYAQLVALLSNPNRSVSSAAANALGSQQSLSFKILHKVGLIAITHDESVSNAIEKLSIECLIETIKEHLLSANLIPLLRLLLIKSHEQKLPIYFLDGEPNTEEQLLGSTKNELHIGPVWQGTFTDQQKQLFIKEFNYVFLQMTGMLPELFFTELKAFKNQLAGQMLNQARVLFQLANKSFPLNCMADKKIVSRILFFTPASQVLDDSQQEKIVNYAEDKKTLRKSLNKVMFWRHIDISNSQNAENVVNTFVLEELNNPKHMNAVENN